MKVGALIKKAGLYKGQSVQVVDHSNNTVEGKTYNMPYLADKEFSDKLTTATVNSFNVSQDGIKIHVTLN